MTKNEIEMEINARLDVLRQHDYTARKVAFENAAKIKELAEKLDVQIEQPVYEEYKKIEMEANGMRLEINDLRGQLENASE